MPLDQSVPLDQLALEIEKLEVSLKEKRDELSSKEEKLEEYKKEVEFKTTRINDLEQISKQNEESHINHYDDMKKKMQEIEEANEELNQELVKASELCDSKEKDKKEMDDLIKTKEHELTQITHRFADLQREFEELQSDKSVIYQNEGVLKQTILNLKSEKEETKEFLEILQKQNDELIRQIEEITMKLRQSEDIVDAQKHKNMETEFILKDIKKKFEEKSRRVSELENEEDKMAACI